MAAPEPHPAFAGYSAVNSQIFFRPSDSPDGIPPDSPTVILLYGWGDGSPKHVAKYADGYRKLYPSARLVAVMGPIFQSISQTLAQRCATMAPVVDAVFGGAEDPAAHAARERVAVVCMSNTGLVNFASTLKAYRDRFGAPFPHRLLVCDSMPGGSNFFQNVAPWSRAVAIGAAASLPWPFVVTQAMAAVLLGGLHVMGWLTGHQSPAEFSANALNDGGFLSVKSAARLYLYSKVDDLISWKDIEAHAADARSKGYDVAMELFEDSPHVAHMRAYPERYWGAINSRWKGLYGS